MKIIDKIKKMLGKYNIYVYISLGIVILIIIVMIILLSKGRKQFELDKVYDIYPSNVKKLYANIVDVSCGGDLKFDIEEGQVVEVKDINQDNLLMYMFSYMDKNNKLGDNLDTEDFSSVSNQLFGINIMNGINSYNYKDYTYTIGSFANDKTVRKKYECVSNNNHINHLSGYSFDDLGLYIDVKIGYTKDGNLYDYHDNLLGEYDGNKEKLSKLMLNASYYRLIYVKDNGELKLNKIKWIKLN